MVDGQTRGSSEDIHLVKTEAQIQADAQQYVEECARGEHGVLPRILAVLNETALRNNRARSETVNATTAELGGNVRPVPQIPAVNYLDIDHNTLKQSVTQAADPGIVGETGAIWKQLGEEMIGFQRVFAKAIDDSRFEWRGDAGNAAREYLAKVGNYIGTAGSGAKLVGTQAEEHSQALQSARTMPDPVNFDEQAAIDDIVRTTDPNEHARKTDEFWKNYDAKIAAHEEAARVAGVFDRSIAGASTLPSFPAPPAFGGGDGAGPAPDPGPGGGARPHPKGPGVAPFTGGQGGGGEAIAPVVAPVAPVRHVETVGRSPDQTVTPERADPYRSTRAPGDVNVAVRGGGGEQAQQPPGMVPPIGGFGPGGVGSGAGPGAGGAVRGEGARGRGFGPYGSPGGGSARGFGGGGGAPATGFGAGGRETGGRGAAGTGAAPLGAGRRDDGGDGEHQRPEFLVEADPESLFGTDEATAPPVIGA